MGKHSKTGREPVPVIILAWPFLWVLGWLGEKLFPLDLNMVWDDDETF